MDKSWALSKDVEMSLEQDISYAFSSKEIPVRVIDDGDVVSPEKRDALYFLSKNVKDVGYRDWDDHPDALFLFLPGAFFYYLPSLLLASLDISLPRLAAADALIDMLDRSPDPALWDDHLVERFSGWNHEQYLCLKNWIAFISDQCSVDDEWRYFRAYETIDLFEQATSRGGQS